ncbi:MAG TPA: uroporphyrinogen-III C-methyltransferase [Woeseiaceae bacterium]|nr:uroporphyrinogen-III C-methyltransferase [Woeseiaceae bacterium]
MTENNDDVDIRPDAPAPEEPAPAAEAPAKGAPPDLAAADAQEAAAAEEAAVPAAAPAPKARRGVTGLLAGLALLVALAALAGVGWLTWRGPGDDEALAALRRATETALEDTNRTLGELRESADGLGRRIAELETGARDRGRQLDGLRDELDALAERLESLPPRVASLEDAVSALGGISAGSRRAWLLAEAEHYMQIANAELTLAGDPEQALLALRFADERIRSLDDPSLAGVRQALIDEIRALEAMETPDLAGVTMTLASLAESAATLPLAEDVAARGDRRRAQVPEASGGLERAIASVKSAFRDVVSVRRADENVAPLLSPEAEYFLRENLALKLQIARLAVLRGEQAALDRALLDAADWLRRYFDPEARAVRSALATIAGIREADWSVSPPDISGSLRLLRGLRERPPPAAAEQPAADDEPTQ